ncbi:MAG: DUF2924 domain-containing protein [Phycisphaerae bacterium]|nr:DUF2924 domain-containing protein [Phycisphaerae bacterium]
MAYFPPPEGATIDVAVELEQLAALSVGGLHDRYVEVFGEKPRSRHRQYLMRRIIWGLQANAEGGLSERARRRAAELADVADVRAPPPRWAFLEKDNVPPAGATVRVPVRPRAETQRQRANLRRGRIENHPIVRTMCQRRETRRRFERR